MEPTHEKAEENNKNGETEEDKPFVCQKSINSGSKTELSYTPFRQVEKLYKIYKPAEGNKNNNNSKRGRSNAKTKSADTVCCEQQQESTDCELFKDIVDVRNLDRNTPENRDKIKLFCEGVEIPASTPPTTGKPATTTTVSAYCFTGVPGLLILPNAIPNPKDQLHWCQQALSVFSKPPFPNNLSNLDPAYQGGYCPKMRWATLGHKYNWTTKTYDHLDDPSPFPEDLKLLVETVVARVDAQNPAFASGRAYEAQTAIVNYFPVGTMMMAHQDVSEKCLEQPLVSISLGCTSIFLMGTERREDKPYAFFLRSGDVAMFRGSSRAAYHAVPRILDDCPSHLYQEQEPEKDGNEEQDEREVMAVMEHMRVNINVRQVLPQEPRQEGGEVSK